MPEKQTPLDHHLLSPTEKVKVQISSEGCGTTIWESDFIQGQDPSPPATRIQTRGQNSSHRTDESGRRQSETIQSTRRGKNTS